MRTNIRIRDRARYAQPFAQLIMRCLLAPTLIVVLGLVIGATQPHARPHNVPSPTPAVSTPAATPVSPVLALCAPNSIATYDFYQGQMVNAHGPYEIVTWSCAYSGYQPTPHDMDLMMNSSATHQTGCLLQDAALDPEGVSLFYYCLPVFYTTPRSVH